MFVTSEYNSVGPDVEVVYSCGHPSLRLLKSSLLNQYDANRKQNEAFAALEYQFRGGGGEGGA